MVEPCSSSERYRSAGVAGGGPAGVCDGPASEAACSLTLSLRKDSSCEDIRVCSRDMSLLLRRLSDSSADMRRIALSIPSSLPLSSCMISASIESRRSLNACSLIASWSACVGLRDRDAECRGMLLVGNKTPSSAVAVHCPQWRSHGCSRERWMKYLGPSR